MRLVATRQLPIGYPEPADEEKPDGPRLVVVYEAGDEIQNVEQVENLEGLLDAGYIEEEE